METLCSMENDHDTGNRQEDSEFCMRGETESTPNNHGESCQKGEQNVDSLIRTPETLAVLTSSGLMVETIVSLAMHGTGMAFFVAFLPVTLPFCIMRHSADLILGACSHLASSSVGIINNTLHPSGEDTASFSVIDGCVHHLSNAIPTVLHAAETIKNDIGGLIMGALSPLLGNEQPQEALPAAGESSSENETYIDRLKLDLYLDTKTEDTDDEDLRSDDKTENTDDTDSHSDNKTDHSDDEDENLSDCNFNPDSKELSVIVKIDEDSHSDNKTDHSDDEDENSSDCNFNADSKELSVIVKVDKSTRVNSSSDVSKFLLRVDDLNLYGDNGEQNLMYVDLDPYFQNEEYFTSKALETLYFNGLALVSLGIECPPRKQIGIRWKPEGETSRLMKRKEAGMLSEAWNHIMQKDVLIWSSSFQGSQVFLSRGIVPGSPRDLFDLLWDSERTSEYNEYCVGRSDVLIIENSKDISTDRAIKVVKSETRVPYTSFSAVICTVMYGSALVTNNDDNTGKSYIIVGRSLTSGRAGFHTNNEGVEHNQKNEIRWSVNLLRAVPDQAALTELVTFSQINSSMIPQFLAHRVGIAAVNKCFKSIRIREREFNN